MGVEPLAAGGNGSLKAKHPAAGRFFVICLKKIATLIRFGSHFTRFQSHFKTTKFLRFGNQLNKSLSLLQVKFKTRLKSYILGLNFVTRPKSGKSRYIAFCNIFSIKYCTRRFAFEDFCFVIKITSFRNICTTGGPGILDSTSIICSIKHFP